MLQFDLPWYVKIATPTALSTSALRPGIELSVVQLLYRSVRYHHVSFAPEQASAFRRHASQGASLVVQVCCGGILALHWVQTSKETCVGVESQLRWMQDRAHRIVLVVAL